MTSSKEVTYSSLLVCVLVYRTTQTVINGFAPNLMALWRVGQESNDKDFVLIRIKLSISDGVDEVCPLPSASLVVVTEFDARINSNKSHKSNL